MPPMNSLILTLLSLHTLVAFAGSVQKPDLSLPPSVNAVANQDQVLTIFKDSYAVYKKFAFTHDDVSPQQQSFSDGRNGWGATIVDAMSTMHIMNLTDLFTEAVDFASKIDFSTSKAGGTVSVFETTIRYLGGLLSAFELSGKQYPALLTKATEVADKMAFAWLNGGDIPFSQVDFSKNAPVSGATSNIAEAGSLTLEWATLSKYTGNDTYRQLAEKALKHIANLGTPLPGLPAQGIDPATGMSVGKYVTWGGGSDSYFEYLIKYARLNNTQDPIFADTWRTAVDSSIHTLIKTSTVGNHVYLADYDDTGKIRHVGSHLACFYGGNWLLGGRLANNDTIVQRGLELVDACWNTYASTATMIGPETFAFESSDGNFTGGSATQEQLDFYQEHGFYITAADYILRPEVLESNFYAWRVTGNPQYLDRAASAIQNFQKYLRLSNGGYVGLNDVNNPSSSIIDDTQSFWFAEVLKYLYLTFDDPSRFSLDDYVFNTEAHPFKAPPALPVYGTGALRPSPQPFTTTSGDLPEISSIAGLGDLLKGLGSLTSIL